MGSFSIMIAAVSSQYQNSAICKVC